MKSLILYWGCMIVFYIIASKLRSKKEKFSWAPKAINWVVYLVVVLMGLVMGSNKEITSSLGTIGVQSLIATIFVIAGSFIFVWIARKIFKIGRDARPIAKLDDKEAGKSGASSKRTKIEVDSENIKFTIIILVLLAASMLIGYFFIIKIFGSYEAFDNFQGKAMTVGIALLLASVGFNLGLDGTIAQCFKTAGVTALIIPIISIIGSGIFGAIYGFISPLTVKEGVCVAFGFGWYTLAPGIIADAGYTVGSAVCFLTNVIRETLGIIFIPLVAQTLGNIEAASLPGVAAMDICLPIVDRTCSEETLIYSVAFGALTALTCCITVPMIIGL